MHRIPGWVWAVGVTALVAYQGPARAGGVWVTLAAGLPGASAPSSEVDLLFDSPHAPPYVAITSTPGKIEAGTAGGITNFGGLATPVLLNLGDGSAYISGGTSAPDAAKSRGPNGGSAGAGASTAPLSNATLPDTAALLGTGTVTVPENGYYVLTLGPDSTAPPPPIDPPPPPVVTPPVVTPPVVDPPVVTPPVVEPPVVTPPVVDPPVVSPPVPVDDGPGPVATPEPSTLALVAVGGVFAGLGRRLRGRRK